jgi:hypothetical protein
MMQSEICSLALAAAAPVGVLAVVAMFNEWQSSDVTEECVGGRNGCNEGGECLTGAKWACCALRSSSRRSNAG